MANLYYNNAASDGDWGNLANWWQDDAFTIPATALPTASDDINLYNEVTQNTQGTCYCNTGSFWSANFAAGLTLTASGTVNMQGSSILAGTTTDGVSMHDSSQITSTGVVHGDVTLRDGSTNAGTIDGNAYVYYDGGAGHYPIGGSVGGSVTYNGFPFLYYTNASSDGTWETLTNWNTASDGSGDNPTNIPWTDDGSGGAWYAGYDLVDATSGSPINVYSVIDPNQVVSGSCSLVGVTNFGTFYGGTFSGDGFWCQVGDIYGGLFTGNGFALLGNGQTTFGGSIYGGTFTGDGFYSFDNGTIYNGTFTGNGFQNGAYIDGGTFSNNGFYNEGTINGGDFSAVANFSVYGVVTGINGGIPPAYLFPTTELHYTNAGNDFTWENLANWLNPSTDGNTYGAWSQVTNIPWTDNGSGGSWYAGTNLVDASGNVQVTNSSSIGSNVSASCDIFINNISNISGGSFTAQIYNNGGGAIYNGTFSGGVSNFNANSQGVIYYGTFNCSVDNSGIINGGIFNGYVNNDANVNASIYNATLTAWVSNGVGASISYSTITGPVDNNGYITGITFSGNGFNNAQGAQVTNSDFTNGTGFGDWSVQECYFGYSGTTQYNGNTYAYISEWIATTFPQSGGGGGVDLARLLGLPFFVKI